jgi:hypothetical protein
MNFSVPDCRPTVFEMVESKNHARHPGAARKHCNHKQRAFAEPVDPGTVFLTYGLL